MTTTTNKGYTLPNVGGDYGTWGGETNGNWGIVDANLGGLTTINCAGSSDVTVTPTQAQNLTLQLTGALTGNINLILPAVGGFYFIENQTTGAYTITVITAAGGSIGVGSPQGGNIFVYSDSTNVYIPSTAGLGWQTINTYSPASSSAQPFALPSGFQRYRLTLQDTTVSANATSLYLQFSSNGGSSFIGSGYSYAFGQVSAVGGGTFSGAGSGSATGILIGNSLSNSSIGALDASIQMSPGSSVLVARVFGSGQEVTSSDSLTLTIGGSSPLLSPALMNFAQIIPSGGTFSGTMILEGLP
jgi:hypothetical protein